MARSAADLFGAIAAAAIIALVSLVDEPHAEMLETRPHYEPLRVAQRVMSSPLARRMTLLWAFADGSRAMFASTAPYAYVILPIYNILSHLDCINCFYSGSNVSFSTLVDAGFSMRLACQLRWCRPLCLRSSCLQWPPCPRG